MVQLYSNRPVSLLRKQSDEVQLTLKQFGQYLQQPRFRYWCDTRTWDQARVKKQESKSVSERRVSYWQTDLSYQQGNWNETNQTIKIAKLPTSNVNETSIYFLGSRSLWLGLSLRLGFSLWHGLSLWLGLSLRLRLRFRLRRSCLQRTDGCLWARKTVEPVISLSNNRFCNRSPGCCRWINVCIACRSSMKQIIITKNVKQLFETTVLSFQRTFQF